MNPENVKRVLFVCIENAGRSQMAEAFARIHGANKIEPYSAGSRPSGKLNPKAMDAMRERGYDLSTHRSKSHTQIPDIEYDAVVTMGCGDEFPLVNAKKRENWSIPDPKTMDAIESPASPRSHRNQGQEDDRGLVRSQCPI
jgi:arsenate reductase